VTLILWIAESFNQINKYKPIFIMVALGFPSHHIPMTFLINGVLQLSYSRPWSPQLHAKYLRRFGPSERCAVFWHRFNRTLKNSFRMNTIAVLIGKGPWKTLKYGVWFATRSRIMTLFRLRILTPCKMHKLKLTQLMNGYFKRNSLEIWWSDRNT